MKIQELEHKTGLDRATIRYYEKEGMIHPARLENGYRNYSDDDLQHLEKISLLRQLDLSLEQIKRLQQGNAVLQDTIQQQIQYLSDKKNKFSQAIQICQMLNDSKVTYQTLDPDLYRSSFPSVIPKPATDDHPIPEADEMHEWHPFRRFFARIFDYIVLLTLFIFVQIVILRVGWSLWYPTNILIILLMIPYEALCYHFFGSTVGKFAFGIHLSSCFGRKLSWSDAYLRAFRVSLSGYFFGLPIISILRLWRRFREYMDDELYWDEDIILTYKPYNLIFFCKMFLVVSITIGMIWSSNHIASLPKNVSNDLTISMFVDNYNDYWQHGEGEKHFLMDVNGTIEESDEKFHFIVQPNHIVAVNYEKTFPVYSSANVLPDSCMIAAFSVIGAKTGADTETLMQFQSNYMKEIKRAIENDTYKVTMYYEQFQIDWEIQFENCNIFTINGVTAAHCKEFKNPPTATLTVQFSIQIHEENIA